MKNKNKELQKSIEQIYDDYQDIGKMAFNYSDKIEQKDRQIDLMAEAISFIDTDIKAIQRQVKEQYCDFIKSDVDCCWKTDKACIDCIKQYFENKAKELLNK